MLFNSFIEQNTHRKYWVIIQFI